MPLFSGTAAEQANRRLAVQGTLAVARACLQIAVEESMSENMRRGLQCTGSAIRQTPGLISRALNQQRAFRRVVTAGYVVAGVGQVAFELARDDLSAPASIEHPLSQITGNPLSIVSPLTPGLLDIKQESPDLVLAEAA